MSASTVITFGCTSRIPPATNTSSSSLPGFWIRTAPAYAIAAGSCVALVGYYVGHVLKSVRRGALFALALSALYGLLYVLLRAEDHALLMGSLLVFVCVASAMVATRRVDWYAFGANPSGTGEPAARKSA